MRDAAQEAPANLGRQQRAMVCDVQRFSVHDGPGIRTTVFFKGCPLACRWCQNPETISFSNQPIYQRADCLGCGDCVSACPAAAISLTGPREVTIDHGRCEGCLSCTERCPGGALSPAARSVDPAGLLEEVSRDTDYYGQDGGITLSGGEPLAQAAFLQEFLPLARARGLHVTAQTVGHVGAATLARLSRQIDLFLFDLKTIDDTLHRDLTGRGNELILKNLSWLARAGRPLEVRMPVLPGVNDHERHLENTARFLRGLDLTDITLLPYHRLGLAKLAKLAPPFEPIATRPPTDGELAAVVEAFGRGGVTATENAKDPSAG